MAYKRLTGVSLNNPKETFQHIRDFLCKLNGIADYSTSGIGWTLHDAVYAVSSSNISINDYFVVYSPGEDGNRQLYFRFQYVSGTINVYGYLHWNSSTHAGTQLYGAGSTWTNNLDTNNILQIYGDLDAVSLIAKYGASYYAQFIGWMPGSRRSTTVTTIGSAITSGSNKVVTFSGGIPSGWAVGKYVFMYDNANIERVLISVISGNDVTFASVASSYSSGAKFIMEDTYYCTAGNGATWYRRIGNNGTKADTVTMYNHNGIPVTTGDPLDSYPYPAMKLILYNTTSVISHLKNVLIGVNNFTQESTHTVDGVQYKYIGCSSGFAALFKDA